MNNIDERLENLIKEGTSLLDKVISLIKGNNDYLGTDLSSDIKALHVQGRFLIRKIDKITFEEYNNLFAQTLGRDLTWYQYNEYIKSELEKCVGTLKAVSKSGLSEALGQRAPNIFISHGRFGVPFNKLEEFIRAVGCTPIFDVNEPSGGHSINQHVMNLIETSDFYVILATIETTNQQGKKLPNHNVIIEYDRLIQSQANNMIVLLEKECTMPSMVQEIIHVPFTQESMDEAFTKLAME